MAKSARFLAFDFGAESGRAVAAELSGSKITLQQLHRFPTGVTTLHGKLYWDILRLYSEVLAGMRAYVGKHGPECSGIGVDTWGVDFGLIGADGELLGNPRAYRDPRTHGMMEAVFKVVPREEVYERTGIQFMQINTLYHLYAMVTEKSPFLESAETFLMMSGLFNYFLTGRRVAEFSNATTTQIYDPRKKRWSLELCDALGIPVQMLPEIVPPGTVIGDLLPEIAEEVGLAKTPVIAPACHDTGSAVAAVPAEGDSWAYLSSGTWSLMGAEVPEPIITSKSLEHNFTNEGGVGGTIRFLKNIMGLWIVQQCRATWAARGEDHSYSEMARMAESALPFESIIDVDDASFLAPGDMPSRVQEACRNTGQPVPEDKGAILRCVFESLALKYRYVFESLQDALGRNIGRLHIVGGGCQNALLNRFTADACGVPVVTGPVEATAIGNVLMQAVAVGHFKSVAEGREAVRVSFEGDRYDPLGDPGWDAAYDKLLDLMK